jgi:hypothetical protein
MRARRHWVRGMAPVIALLREVKRPAPPEKENAGGGWAGGGCAGINIRVQAVYV